jgi:hypothetical protein
MIIKIGELTQEQFYALTTFLASKANLINPPAGTRVDAYKQGGWTNKGDDPLHFAKMMESKLCQISYAVTLQTVDEVILCNTNSGLGTGKKTFVPQSYLLALLGSMGLFPLSFVSE